MSIGKDGRIESTSLGGCEQRCLLIRVPLLDKLPAQVCSGTWRQARGNFTCKVAPAASQILKFTV